MMLYLDILANNFIIYCIGRLAAVDDKTINWSLFYNNKRIIKIFTSNTFGIFAFIDAFLSSFNLKLTNLLCTRKK